MLGLRRQVGRGKIDPTVGAVNWLVDTQLPHQLATALKKRGHQAKHVSELPGGNRTQDDEVIAFAKEAKAVVVTKDGDFVASRILSGAPERLVLVTTGNVQNADLILAFMHHLDQIADALRQGGFVELDRKGITVR